MALVCTFSEYCVFKSTPKSKLRKASVRRAQSPSRQYLYPPHDHQPSTLELITTRINSLYGLKIETVKVTIRFSREMMGCLRFREGMAVWAGATHQPTRTKLTTANILFNPENIWSNCED